ncbi:MAG: LLM class flavin-dependent oxidoreductase [Dehalococcoidia bacterium]|nr:MAG: LLM class flavin-dependent oxidoreductase [Dehalococcoidia bacterium]
MSATVGVAIQALNAHDFVTQVRQAEMAGVPVAWTTIGGAGGADPLTVFAAALTATDRIRLGTAIVPTWPRHPIIIAQQALALEQIASGRLRLGIGPSHEPGMVRNFGVRWEAPLTELREYLTVIRSLATTGTVDFVGRHVTARATFREPQPLELLASALRPKSFEVCGELTDGAISWMCPASYLIREALPAIRRGAERAGRPAPPLIAHVPIMVSEDREAVRALARQQLGNYANVPFYLAMFREAGFPEASAGYSDAMLDDLVVSGTTEEVVGRLTRMIADGCGEVLAHPLLEPGDREGSIERAFHAVALAHQRVSRT